MRAAILLLLVGPALIAIAVFDPGFVMEGPRVRSLVGLLGRGGTRVVYAVIGVVMVVAGVYALTRDP